MSALARYLHSDDEPPCGAHFIAEPDGSRSCMKRPIATITAVPDSRPWWAPWRRTVSLKCSEHGVFIAGLSPVVTESDFDPLALVSRLHFARHDHRSIGQ